MTLSRREQQEKDLKAVLAKDIGAKNPVFSLDFIADLHSMFSLYADPRQRRADIRDILMTAKTLGLDTKFEIVFRALEEICDQVGADALDFETFLKELTAKVVQIHLFREILTQLKEDQQTFLYWIPRAKVNSISMTWDTLTSSCIMDTLRNNSKIWLNQLVVSEPRLSPLTDTTRFSRKEFLTEKQEFDHR